MRCDFRQHSWWHWPLVLDTHIKFSLESRACWLLLAIRATTTFPIVARGQCRAWHSSACRACSAKPGHTHWFASTKSMQRLIQNLPRTIQLARFSCPFWWKQRKRGCWAKSSTSLSGFTAIGASGMGPVIVVHSVAHYGFMECNTNEITVLSYLTSHFKQATGLPKIFANRNLFFSIEWKTINVYVTQRYFCLLCMRFCE